MKKQSLFRRNKSFKRVMSTSAAILLSMSMVLPNAVYAFTSSSYHTMGTLVSDLTNWTSVGGTITETANGYELSNNENSFAISDQRASSFSLESDITILEGDRATLAYGMSNSKAPGQIWRGIEVMKTSATEGQVKAFIADGPETVAKVNLTGMDWSKPVKLKAEMDDNKGLKVYVNGQLMGTGSDPTFLSGYVGILTFKSKALFNNIKYTGKMLVGNAVSDITNWTSVGGTFTNTADGYVMTLNNRGDNFAVSDKNTSSFTFETDIKILDGEGQRASLIYGVNSWSNLGPWRGVEVMKTSETTVQVKAFNTAGSDVIPALPITNIDWTKPVKCKITMDDSKKLIVYINQNKVAEGQDSSYSGGYVGFVTWKTQALFNNIKFITNTVNSSFHTTLKDFAGLNGTWLPNNDGIYSSGSGDNFALSSSTGTDFTYEANVKFGQQKGAASLIFLSSDNPGQNSYCVNIDLNQKNARLFKFGGSSLGEFILPTSMQNKTDYKMRVEVIGKYINYYIDGVLAVSYVDKNKTSSTSGRFGLLTFDTTVTYQNVYHTIITDANKPTLTNLEVKDLSFKTGFDPNQFAYDVTVPKGTASIAVKNTAAEQTTATVTAANSDGSSIDVSASNGYVNVPLVQDNANIIVTVKKSDITLSYVIRVQREKDLSQMYNEKYRPQLHFSPQKNFINDPNGLVYDPSNKTYHMFYQYNPRGMNIGNQVWGHAESTDLVNWRQIDEIAIDQDDGLGAIFSGSAVVDENNTSGLFTDNKPGESKLVAIFTHDGGDTTLGYEKQSIAYSKDHGHTWTKPSLSKEGFKNPVISNENNKWGRDFRDPKVFWYDGQWMMVIAGGHARVFASPNLRDWTEVCDMGFDSECPGFYPLPVDGNTNNTKWVYNASGRWYVIGDFKKDAIVNGVQRYKFVGETERIAYNGGPNVYATQSYFNDGSNQNRVLSVSWMQDNTASALSSEGKVWNGAMTLPYVTEIKTINGKMRLTSYPLEEINKQRSSAPIYSATNKAVNQSTPNILSGVSGQKYDIQATFTIGNATEFGFKLRKGIGQETTVKYNKETKKFILDCNKSGKVLNGAYSMDMSPAQDGKVTMRIVVDTSMIETFGNGGEAANSYLFFPDPTSIGMEFFTNGSVTVDSMNIYGMKSIWHDDSASGTQATNIYFSASDSNVDIGKEITIYSNVAPTTAANKKVKWNVTDKTVFSVVSETDSSITLKALKEGNCTVTATIDGGVLQNNVTMHAVTVTFNTNLKDWYGSKGVWEVKTGGLSTEGTNGDAFAFSKNTAKVFVYEGDATPKSGIGCPGLVFGVTNPENPSSGTWYGANVDTNGSGEVTAKLFENTNASEVWKVTKAVSRTDGKYHLKVEMSLDGTVKYWVNNVLIGEKNIADFKEGTLGLVSYNSGVTFDNVYFNEIKAISGVSLNKSKLELAIGANESLIAIVSPSDAENKKVTWKSSSPAVATVDQSGKIKAIKEGTATITVTTLDGNKTASCVVTVKKAPYTGWKQTGSKKYYYVNDIMQKNWQKISNKWYYFASSGVMQTGWQKIINKWYYFTSGGAMQTSWQRISNKWYYFTSDGAMQTGWQRISNKWYYFTSGGAMQTSWQKISGKWYFFTSGGAMQTGWQKISGKWYYFESSGKMLANTSKKIGKKTYKFNQSGICINP
ncbi:MAG: beta-fructosidase, levanase/invertase [Oscillospiraceae bacterium]|nr:beta-fructosidase, levanase/invertase [Oscillospiraceae bacterium]